MMKRLFVLKILFISALISSPLLAQTDPINELKSKIEANVEQQNSYLSLLSDPDPRRAREAMKVFLASGDPDLIRMALNFGLTSSDPVLQRLALEGFFGSAPALQITFDASALKELQGLTSDLRKLGGSLDSAKTGYVNLKLGPRSEEQGCWVWPDSKQCAVRLTDAASAIFFRGYWYPMALEDGVLKGVSTMHYTKQPVPFSIPVAR